MSGSTLTSKGQLTMPKEVRERLGVKEGDRLIFRFTESGQLVVEPERRDPLAGFAGLLRHLAKDRPVSAEEMKKGVREHVAAKFRKSSA
jgi:antitoxin PrlF